jgi:hypothetical protein
MMAKEREREFKEGMTFAAFTAWLQGAGPKKTFPQFLRSCGLVEKEPAMSKEAKRAAIRKARKTAECIMRMDKPRKKK